MATLTENSANGAQIVSVMIDFRLPMGKLIESCDFEHSCLNDENQDDIRFKKNGVKEKDEENADFYICQNWYWSGYYFHPPIFFRPSGRFDFDNVRPATLREFFCLICQHPDLHKRIGLATATPLFSVGDWKGWGVREDEEYVNYYPLCSLTKEGGKGLFKLNGKKNIALIGRVMPKYLTRKDMRSGKYKKNKKGKWVIAT